MRSLVTYTPHSLWTDMERSFNRLFDDRRMSGGPAIDIREEEGRYLVEAEVPGLSDKDIDVKVENDILTLSSSKDESKEEKRNGYLVKERRSTSFRRSFYLPKDVDREKIGAQFENGLLTLELPKQEAAKPRQIEVKKA